MRVQHFRHRLLSSERGSVLVTVTAGLLAILGISALAIDLGMLFSARGEAQRTADAAALSGAQWLVHHPDDVSGARQAATELAAENVVRESSVTLKSGDVTVVTEDRLVKVEVVRSKARGNPVDLLLGRIFGVGGVDLRARATSKVGAAGAVACPFPLTIPDRWDNQGTASWDPDEGDTYDTQTTGYTSDDLGTSVVLKPSGGGGGASGDGPFEPGWWYLYNPDQSGGASGLDEWVTGCQDPGDVVEKGQNITDKNGNNTSIVKAFEDLIALDPNAHYSDGQIVGGEGWSTPRLRSLPLFDPSSYVKTVDNSNFTISNFAGVFVDSVVKTGGTKQVYGTIVNITGAIPQATDDDDSLAKFIQLVE